jgi:tripartite-type tricarboxylate transporter receptor subunit TctC
MEGAGSILAANNVYNVAKPDGLTLGVFNEQMVTNQLIGAEGVQFDARKYGWVGNAQKVNPACTIRADSPYKTAEDLGRKDLPPLIFGATGPGSDTYDFAKLVIVTTGANARVVSGYSGTATIRLAVDGREADGLCWAWDSVLSTAKNWLDSGAINVPIYQAPEADPKIEQLFPTARRLEDLTNDEDTKRLIRASTAASRIAKPFVAPPGVPAERLAALQEAFIAATKDPDLQTDAEQARFEINPNTGEQAAQIVNEILSLPPELTKRLADIRK